MIKAEDIGELQWDTHIRSLFPTFSPESKSTETRERVLAHFAQLTIKKRFGDTTYHYLTHVIKKPLGGTVASNILKEFITKEICIECPAVKNKKNVLKKPYRLTAKGVVACMGLTCFQSPTKVRQLLEGTVDENQQLSKLATLLNIYNEGYADNSGKCDKISPVVTALHELTAKGSLLNFTDMSDDAILKELQHSQETCLIRKRAISPFDMFLSSDVLPEVIKKFLTFKEGLSSKELKPVITISPIIEEVLMSPEARAYITNAKFDVSSLIIDTYKKLADWKIYNKNIETLETIDDVGTYILNSSETECSPNHISKAIREVMLEQTPSNIKSFSQQIYEEKFTFLSKIANLLGHPEAEHVIKTMLKNIETILKKPTKDACLQ